MEIEDLTPEQLEILSAAFFALMPVFQPLLDLINIIVRHVWETIKEVMENDLL